MCLEEPMKKTSVSRATISGTNSPSDADQPLRKVVVCVDNSGCATKALRRTLDVADALDANVLLTHVVEPSKQVLVPFDPVEWDIRKREAKSYVDELANRYSDSLRTIETNILEGRCAEQIHEYVSDYPENIVALTRGLDPSSWHLGDTVRRLIESGSGSILLVPSETSGQSSGKIKTILVPLDGSTRAESALPTALSIARIAGSRVVLVHASLEPSLTILGPVEPEDASLIERIAMRNEIIGREYLERTRKRVCAFESRMDIAVVRGGDARRLILESIKEHSADLLVMASHGRSGHADAPLGDVAHFILARSPIPVLMVRPDPVSNTNHVYGLAQAKGIRRPAAAA